MLQDQDSKPEDTNLEPTHHRDEPTEDKPKKGKMKKIDVYITFSHVLQRKPMASQWKPFSHRFHVLKDKSGTHQYLQEGENQVLFPISSQKILDALISYFHHDCFHMQATDIKISEFADAIKYWAAMTPSLAETIEPVRSKSNSGYTWHKLPFDLQKGKHPHWDELLSRMSNAEAFTCWVASLLDAKSNCQQYVWLYGEGRNGKGAVARFLTKLMGPASIWERVPNESDRFWTSGLIGKRLVIFDDCERYNFPSSGLFKTLTGGSDIRVERKNATSFTAPLNAKYIFTSNTNPTLSSKEADLRRSIYCEVGNITKPFGSDYEDQLWKEAPNFLHYCWLKYRDLCPDSKEIPVDRSQIEMLASNNEEEFQIIWDKYFIPSPESSIAPKKLSEVFKAEGLYSDQNIRRFKDWMTRIHGVKKRSITLKNGREWRYIGLREKPFYHSLKS